MQLQKKYCCKPLAQMYLSYPESVSDKWNQVYVSACVTTEILNHTPNITRNWQWEGVEISLAVLVCFSSFTSVKQILIA